MDTTLSTRLLASNPWLFGRGLPSEVPQSVLPDPWVPRRQVAAASFAEAGQAHLVIGPRQAGKSTLAWSYLRGRRRPLVLNLEEPTFRAWCRSAIGFLGDIAEAGLAPDALFLDEAQHLEEAGLFVKGVVDAKPGFPILVTGSSSFHLLASTRESLAGRARRHVLLPFSLAEVCPPAESPLQRRLERDAAWLRLARVGGYPRAWLGEDATGTLSGLVEAFLLRDASDLLQVERLDAFHTLLRLAAGQIGNLVNLSEWASIAGISVATVSRYLALMEQTHLLRLVASFSGGQRKEVTSARKVFFLDNGLRNALLGQVEAAFDLRPDRGALLENLVFTELAKTLPWTKPVRYWRSLSGAEVDFVVELPGGLLAVEVKAAAQSAPRVSRSLRSFAAAYRPREAWVVNAGQDARIELEGVPVRWVPMAVLPEALAEVAGAWATCP
jgi:predicted AAA+ superfamily ATPase